MRAAGSFEIRIDGVDGDCADRVVIFPRRVAIIQSFPFTQVFDYQSSQLAVRRGSGAD